MVVQNITVVVVSLDGSTNRHRQTKTIKDFFTTVRTVVVKSKKYLSYTRTRRRVE